MSKNETTINKRFLDLIIAKKNQTLKKVLTAMEEECKKYDINSDFFEQCTDKKHGYSKIRKILLDDFNDITRFVELVLEQVEIEPVKAVIKLSQEVLDEIQDNTKYPETK